MSKQCSECKNIFHSLSWSGICEICERKICEEKNEKARITALIKQIPKLIELLEKIDV